MSVEVNPDSRYIAGAQAFSLCTVCDSQYPGELHECAKCKSPLSVVRKCPKCNRVQSAKHERCLYCALSFIETSPVIVASATPAAPAPKGLSEAEQRRRAILVSVAVFLVVLFVGIWASVIKSKTSSNEVAATSFSVGNAQLRLQPSLTSGTSANLAPGTVISMTGMAVDPEGHRWFVTHQQDADRFIAITEVAPPKAVLQEQGAHMLRSWLLAFKDPALIPDADSAVSYYCVQFSQSPHCDELRWLAAERFRSIGPRGNDREALNRAQKLYQAVAEGKSSNAVEAKKMLESFNTGSETSPVRTGQRSGKDKTPQANSSFNGRNEYALVDRAEVRVKIPDFKSLKPGESVRTPIAKEIRINGKVAVPKNAICILQVSNTGDEPMVQLTGIEVGSKHYSVTTTPRRVAQSDSTVVFPLESSLLIGH